jgi:hypothetical protein
MWATRFWWMLESLGFKCASVLDGGLEKWSGEGRPIERGPPRWYPRGTFTATPRPGFFVDKHTVLAAWNDPRVVVINALGPQFHKGLEPSRYGRPGRFDSKGRGSPPWRIRGVGLPRYIPPIEDPTIVSVVRLRYIYLRKCTYRFAGGRASGNGRATSTDCCFVTGGCCAVPISRSTDSRLPSKAFIVPLTNPAWPQKH